MDKLRKFDSFGRGVNLNLQGEQTIKSASGGCISILMYLTLLIPFTQLFIAMIKRQEPIVESYDEIEVDSV